MSEKENEIKEIALKLFIHHGWTKVTMSDIADAVSISRPTLYKMFASKEDIFSSLIKEMVETHKRTALGRIKKAKGTENKLKELFDVWVIEPYSTFPETENSKDFMENCGKYVPDAMNHLYNEFELQLKDILEDGQKGKSKMEVKDTAHLMILAARSLKASAPPLKDLKRMIGNLISMGL